MGNVEFKCSFKPWHVNHSFLAIFTYYLVITHLISLLFLFYHFGKNQHPSAQNSYSYHIGKEVKRVKFHEKLKAYRDEQLDISQDEAAKLLKVSNATLSRYESSKRLPSLEMVFAIRKAYQLTDEQFLDLLTDDSSKRKSTESFVEQAHESQGRYYGQFSPLLEELLPLDDFRSLLLQLRDLSKEEQEKLLRNLLKSIT